MSIPEDTDTVLDAVERLYANHRHGDTLAAMRDVNEIADVMPNIATALVEQGVREGLTLKAMAEALGVPPRTLSGAKAAFAR